MRKRRPLIESIDYSLEDYFEESEDINPYFFVSLNPDKEIPNLQKYATEADIALKKFVVPDILDILDDWDFKSRQGSVNRGFVDYIFKPSTEKIISFELYPNQICSLVELKIEITYSPVFKALNIICGFDIRLKGAQKYICLFNVSNNKNNHIQENYMSFKNRIIDRKIAGQLLSLVNLFRKNLPKLERNYFLYSPNSISLQSCHI